MTSAVSSINNVVRWQTVAAASIAVGVIGALAVPSLRNSLYRFFLGNQQEYEQKKRKAKHRKTLKKVKLASNALVRDYQRLEAESQEALSIWINTRQSRSTVTSPIGQIQIQDSKGNLKSGYYHFDSKGNKIKNKWENFNVDEELKKLDEKEEDHQQMTNCLTNLNTLKEQGLKIIILLDGMKDLDAETKKERKKCIRHLQDELLDKVDFLADELEENISTARGTEYVPKTTEKRKKFKRKKSKENRG